MNYLLYNPNSGAQGASKQSAEAFCALSSEPAQILDATSIYYYNDFLEALEPEDAVYIFGGDGTLNRFVNGIKKDVKHSVYYYPCGSGNDFARDIRKADEKMPFEITHYINKLPTVTVKGETRRFINGIGFGIDGYCCAEGDRCKAEGKAVNYTAIAIKGLLGNFKSRCATVTVDGKRFEFKRVWLAPTMFGSHYGGGMIPTPNQRRGSKEKKVSLMVFHDCGRLKTLMIFPSIFKGKHVDHKRNVSIFSGKEITVKFNMPTPLQIDGETVNDVSEYTVRI